MGEFFRRLAFLFRKRQFDRDLEEEVRYHLERKAERIQDDGLSPTEAGYAARRQFGNGATLMEASREAWGWAWLEQTAQDVRLAFRSLRKNPGFAGVAVLTLALGIGANTAVFSVVNAILFRPLPFKDPQRLAMIWQSWAKGGEKTAFVSGPNFRDWKDQSQTIEGMAPMRGGGSIIPIAGEPTEIPGKLVGRGFFEVLGAKAMLGRTFVPEELNGGGAKVAVIAHRLWQKLGGDPNLVGKAIELNREMQTIVGVMPPGFDFPDESEVWLPYPDSEFYADNQRTSHSLKVVGRVKPGITMAQAQAEMNTISARIEQAHPETATWIRGANVFPLQEQIVGSSRRALLVLLAAVGCVLLIACANIANLLLARGASRQPEVALRLALGAGRWRVIRYLLSESMILALAGGGLGVAWAWWGVRAFTHFNPIDLPRIEEVAIDPGMLLFTVLISVLTGLFFGLVPALRVSRPDLNNWLKDGSERQAGAKAGTSRGRAVLAMAQVALAVVLMVGAALLLRSFVARITVPLGFRPEGMLAVELPWSANRQLDRVLERLRAVPGVIAAGASTAFPHQSANTSAGFEVEGKPDINAGDIMAGKMPVTPDYFHAAGIVVRRGRLLTESDGPESAKVVVINEALVRRVFPGEDPIGRHFRFGGSEWATIVGVAGNVKGFGVAGDPQPNVYIPYRQTSWNNPVYILLRTAVPPESIAGAVRKEIRAWNKRILINKIATEDSLLSAMVAAPRFYLLLVAAFATLAMLLAAVGIYGVLNYAVAQRTHEIGVRMALGAQRADVLYMVLTRGLSLIVGGLALGLIGAWASTHLLATLLFGVRPLDTAAFAGAAVALVAIGLLACYVPARRATKVDPMLALRG